MVGEMVKDRVKFAGETVKQAADNGVAAAITDRFKRIGSWRRGSIR